VLHDESGFDTSERIKLTLRTAYKLFELRPTPDFAGRDWTQAKWALRKRHLLMHPKTPADMDIPDDLWKQLAPAMDWLVDQRFTTDRQSARFAASLNLSAVPSHN
jgi:hypothetical protein